MRNSLFNNVINDNDKCVDIGLGIIKFLSSVYSSVDAFIAVIWGFQNAILNWKIWKIFAGFITEIRMCFIVYVCMLFYKLVIFHKMILTIVIGP